MADTKISLLTELTAPVSGDWVPVVDVSGSATKKVDYSRFSTVDDIRNHGAVGDGSTDNKAIIQARIDAANTAGGGTVRIPMDADGGQYNISAGGLDLTANVRLEMDPGVTLMSVGTTVSTDAYVVRVYPDAQILGGKIAVNNNTFTGALVRLDGNDQFNREHQTIISNLMLEGTAQAVKTSVGLCYGLYLWADGDQEYVEYCQFSNITFSMLGQAIRLDARNGAGGDTVNPHVNGNQFVNLQMDNCEYGILTNGDANSHIRANKFVNVQYETVVDSYRFMLMDGLRNVLRNVEIWDWSTSGQTVAIGWSTGLAVDNHIDLTMTGFDAGGAGNIFTGDTDLNSYAFVSRLQGNVRLYTVAAVPTASNYPGAVIYVSNGAAGSPCLAFSDGTNWVRTDDYTTAISAT